MTTDVRTPAPTAPALPAARGPLSERVLGLLTGPPGRARARRARRVRPAGDPWGDDLQLALHLCYELHHRGFRGVDPAWEWDPGLLALRAGMEGAFLGTVRAEVGDPGPLEDVLDGLLVEPADGTGPSHHLLRRGTRWQAREYLVHRSVYHLEEADPQLWMIPRVPHPAKAALVTVQYDEYGSGRPERAHAVLFARMMADLDLDDRYGHYLGAVPAPALAVVNLMELFGLHRALCAAAVGQFAAVEITSPPGAARLAAALERLGASPDGTLFYREHVVADAVHEQLVRRSVIDPLVAADPALAPGIAFGIAATGVVEGRLADHLLDAWERGRSSLRIPLDDGPPR